MGENVNFIKDSNSLGIFNSHATQVLCRFGLFTERSHPSLNTKRGAGGEFKKDENVNFSKDSKGLKPMHNAQFTMHNKKDENVNFLYSGKGLRKQKMPRKPGHF